MLGDLRRLPFADGAFTKGYSLDVFEHLSREALAGVLREASRVLAPGGQLFVYRHVRKNSRLALGLRVINGLAGLLDRAGAVDLTQEHLRKSDHLNPLADIPDLERTVGEAGFRIARIRYYTPLDRRRRREHPGAVRRALDGAAGGAARRSQAGRRRAAGGGRTTGLRTPARRGTRRRSGSRAAGSSSRV